jgi:hypothetical protein
MSNALAVLKLILALLPLIKETIATLEAMFPESGSGPSKSAILMATLKASVAGAEDMKKTFEMALPHLQPIIDSICLVYKKKP